jgi:hypothetical protein
MADTLRKDSNTKPLLPKDMGPITFLVPFLGHVLSDFRTWAAGPNY